MLRSAAQVVVVSPAFRPYVAAAGVPAERVSVVPNWTHVAPSSGDRAQVRRRLGRAEDDVVALHSGNTGLKQGLQNLVTAARLASAPVRVVLVGDGAQRDVLSSLGEGVERLSFLPPADSADLPDARSAATCWWSTSGPAPST